MPRTAPLALAALLACASQQRASTPLPPDAGPDASDRTTVVQPSSLSPDQVRLLQRSLIDRGFAVDLTGRFDEPTQVALAQFQRTRGIPATGNLNSPTIDALGLDPREVAPSRGDAAASGLGTGRDEEGAPTAPGPAGRP